MAKTAKPIFVQKVLNEDAQFTNSDAIGTSKALYTAEATDGGLCNSISVTNTDSAAISLQLFLTPSGGSARLLGTVEIPGLAGTLDANPAIDLLADTNIVGKQADGSYAIEPGGALTLENLVQPASTKLVDIVAFCGDYA